MKYETKRCFKIKVLKSLTKPSNYKKYIKLSLITCFPHSEILLFESMFIACLFCYDVYVHYIKIFISFSFYVL